MNAILHTSNLLDASVPPNGMGMGERPLTSLTLRMTLADWLRMDGRAFLSCCSTRRFNFTAAFTQPITTGADGYDHDAAATFYTALTIGHALECPGTGFMMNGDSQAALASM